MRRTTVNFILDVLSLAALVLLAVTGAIIKWVLPPGSGGYGQGFRGGREPADALDLWGLTRHEWGNIHYVLGVVFLVLMLVHIILHWNWIKCYIGSLSGVSGGHDGQDKCND